jgi:hypothetical protein
MWASIKKVLALFFKWIKSIMPRNYPRVISTYGGITNQNITSSVISSGGPITLTQLNTWTSGNGNSAHIGWTSDSNTVFQANEESNSGFPNMVKISATSASSPSQAGGSKAGQYMWATAVGGTNFVVHSSSNNGDVIGFDANYNVLWHVSPFASSQPFNVSGTDVATDGTYVYLPYAGNNGGLLVLKASDGSQAALKQTGDAWNRCYTLRLTSFSSKTYCLITPGQAWPTTPVLPSGGIYIFDVTTPTSPTYVGKIFNGSWNNDYILNGNTLYLLVSSGTKNENTTTTIGGSATVGDTITLVFTNQYFFPTSTGTTLTVGTIVSGNVIKIHFNNIYWTNTGTEIDYTMQGTDTPSSVASSLTSLINASSALSTFSISATANGSLLTISQGGGQAGNTMINLEVSSTTLTWSASASYTVLSGDGLSQIATGLKSAINGSVLFTSQNISASSSGAVTTISQPGKPPGYYLTFAKSISGAGTETVTFSGDGNGANASRDTIQIWNISTPTSPVSGGTYTAPTQTGYAGGQTQYVDFTSITLNPAGTRLYAAYLSQNAGNGQTANAPAGWVIFDITGTNPVPLNSQTSDGTATGQLRGQWIPSNAAAINFWEQPGFLVSSPDGTKIAMSYWTLGVQFWSISGDIPTLGGVVATTGETKDAFIDNLNNAYIPVGDDLQVVNLSQLITNTDLGYGNGGIRPFKDNRYIAAQGLYSFVGSSVYDFTLGPSGFIYLSSLNTNDTINDFRYVSSSNLLYGAGNSGLHLWSVGVSPSYTLTEQTGFPFNGIGYELNGISAPFQGSDNNTYIAAVSIGNGVYIIQITGTGAPKLSFSDTSAFTRSTIYGNYGTNGPFATAEVARGYIYATCHRSGLSVYSITSGPTFTYIESFPYQCTWVELVNQDLLLINSYNGSYSTTPPDGIYIADIRTNQTSPTFYTGATTPLVGMNGWRKRYWSPYIVACGLGWATQYQINNYP